MSPGGYWCYQEPMHEAVLSSEENPEELLRFTSNDSTSYLRHPQLDRPYFHELVEVFESCKGLLSWDTIYGNYFDQVGDDRLIKYLDALNKAAKGSPVIQECRTTGRVAAIKRSLGGFHVYLWRNPWDQWWSYKANDYFETINQVILNSSSRPKVIDKLRDEIGFVAFTGLGFYDEFLYYNGRPLSSENGYMVFYTLWCLGLLEGASAADLSLNIDALSDSFEYQNEIVSRLNMEGFDSLDFSDCKIPQAYYSEKDRSFFCGIEDRVHGLFLASGYPQSSIDSILQARRDNQPAHWGRAPNQIPMSLAVDQATRLRQLVISTETASSIRQLCLNDLLAQERDHLRVQEEKHQKGLDAVQAEMREAERVWAEKMLEQERASAQEQAELLSQGVSRERELHERLHAAQVEGQKLELKLKETERDMGDALRAERAANQGLERSLQRLRSDLRSIRGSFAWRYSGFLRNAIAWVCRESILLPNVDELVQQQESRSSPYQATASQTCYQPFNKKTTGAEERSMTNATTNLTALMHHDDEQFIERAYFAVLKRMPDFEGKKYYLGLLRGGASKIQILDQLIRSKEAKILPSDIPGLSVALKNHRRSRLLLLGHVFRFFQNAKDESSSISLDALMNYQDSQFVEESYRTLLKRSPDREGLAYYVGRLRAGVPKIQILDQIHRSKEGAAASVTVPGLKSALIFYRLSRLPLIGGVSRFFFKVEGDAIFDRRLRSIEQQLYGLAERIDDGVCLPQGIETLKALPVPSQPHAFFTICSKNFLAHARVLYFSVRAHYPDSRFFVVLCDRVDGMIDAASEPFEFVYLEEIGLPNIEDMASRYSITEFNTATKPFAFLHLMQKHGLDSVIYLDPDILLVDRMVELDSVMANGAEAVLTPHLLQPAENDEVHDGKMLLFGIYNLGFLGLRNTPSVRNFLLWWGRRLERDCVIRLEEGLFVDQKWADLLPAYVPNTQILHHPGYNVAYWNLPQRQIALRGEKWYANKQSLRFVHFSGNQIDNKNVFSRHSQQVTIESIGDLSQLLEYYRQQVYVQGHAFYRKLPYAYSWNGAAGVNLHTPKNLDMAAEEKKRILYLDWAIPKPDHDAASVTAVLLMQIFRSLGYSVTFMPCGLQYEEGYYENLVAEGVEVLCYPRITSPETWLEANASRFDICFMSRGPVVWPYVELLQRVAPNMRLIFNTVDLHYLRERRQAELAGDKGALEAAEVTRERELNLIKQSNVTVVLSSEELYAVRNEIGEASLAVLPIVFRDIPGARQRFGERRDILFIGSFPHLPNVDAVLFFAESVMPIIWKKLPDVNFIIVGTKPPKQIMELAKNPKIKVLGFVQDLEPLFEGIRLSVAPLRYGAGIKGKIGSSLCYGVPCIATAMAVEGMGLVDGRDVLVGDTPNELAEAVCQAYVDENLWQSISEGGHRFASENYSVDVIRDRVRGLLWSVQEGWRAMESMYEIEGWESWQKHHERMSGEYAARLLREQALLPKDIENGFHTHGFCCVCGCETDFLTSFMYSYSKTPDGREMPNWREHMQCGHCKLVNRMRAALHALNTISPPQADSRIYVTERVTPTYNWLHARYKNLQGSEYFGSCHPPGALVNNIRHEDIMHLSFGGNSFDIVLSFDVLEHVPNPLSAFKEIYRVLDKNGVFIFSVPFANNSPTDIIRATLNEDGTVEHHLQPEYHGNPVDPEGGALCFRYFGWEMLDDLRRIGFSRVRALAYWSENQGYLGGEQYLFVAHKSVA